MSYNNNKPAAVWTKAFSIGAVNVSLSDGGSVKFQTEGEARAIFMLPVSQLSTALQVLQSLTPEQVQEIENTGARNKVAKKQNQEITKRLDNAHKLQRAAIDQLIASGMSEEQAKAFLKIA